MFRRPNIYVHAPTISGGQSHVSVTEKRAPTDESVRLLREMETKARDEVVKAIQVRDNNFSGVVQSIVDPVGDEVKFVCIFSLNGKKRTAKYSVSQQDARDLPSVAQGLRDAVATEIANGVIGDLLQRSFHKSSFGI